MYTVYCDDLSCHYQFHFLTVYDHNHAHNHDYNYDYKHNHDYNYDCDHNYDHDSIKN